MVLTGLSRRHIWWDVVFEFYYTVSLNKVNLSGFIFTKKSALPNTPTLNCSVFSVLNALTYSVSFRVWRFDFICLTVSFLIMPLPCAFTRTETREMAFILTSLHLLHRLNFLLVLHIPLRFFTMTSTQTALNGPVSKSPRKCQSLIIYSSWKADK